MKVSDIAKWRTAATDMEIKMRIKVLPLASCLQRLQYHVLLDIDGIRYPFTYYGDIWKRSVNCHSVLHQVMSNCFTCERYSSFREFYEFSAAYCSLSDEDRAMWVVRRHRGEEMVNTFGTEVLAPFKRAWTCGELAKFCNALKINASFEVGDI